MVKKILGACLMISVGGLAFFMYSRNTDIPPEPDPILNNATVAGVDSNTNGIRDDVERIISKEFSGTPDFAPAMEYARIYQAYLTNPPPKSRQEALQLVGQEYCSTINASMKVRSFHMSQIVVNTSERQTALDAFNDVLGLYDSLELVGVAPCLQK